MDKKLKISIILNIIISILLIVNFVGSIVLPRHELILTFMGYYETIKTCLSVCIVIPLIMSVITKIINKKSHWATINIILSVSVVLVFIYFFSFKPYMEGLFASFSDVGFKQSLG